MKINNPFLFLVTILQLFAALYYWKKGNIPLGFIQFFVSLANFAMLQIK
jgi:hypothetical protein